MKGTVFAVALNHQSQIEAWDSTFHQAPYNRPPKTPVWFIKPRNTVIRHGDGIPYPEGFTVMSGATLALVVGQVARHVALKDAAYYIAGFTVPPFKQNAVMDFVLWAIWGRLLIPLRLRLLP